MLQALGRTRLEAEASLRLSLGRDTTDDDIQQAVNAVCEAVAAAQR